MADKTTYLQLNKPGANARGWGSALNNNMDILDNAYNSTNSRINSLQLQLGEMNYISFMPNKDYVVFNEKDGYISYLNGKEFSSKLPDNLEAVKRAYFD